MSGTGQGMRSLISNIKEFVVHTVKSDKAESVLKHFNRNDRVFLNIYIFFPSTLIYYLNNTVIMVGEKNNYKYLSFTCYFD